MVKISNRNPGNSTAQWVCVIRNDRMGDLILTLPILQAIKFQNPYLKIVLVCSTINKKVAKQYDFIDAKVIVSEDRNQETLNKTLSALSQYSISHAFNCAPGLWNIRLLAAIESGHKASMLYYSRYKSSNILSKLHERMICWRHGIKLTVIDRVARFKKSQSIQQTKMIYEMVSQSIPIRTIQNVVGPMRQLQIENTSPYLVIHASGRWVKKNYTEQQFIDLVKGISQTHQVIITTDESSSTVFSALYKRFPLVSSEQLSNKQSKKQRVMIADQFNFDQWQAVVAMANGVVTVECGIIHIAALYNKRTISVYDMDNLPHMMYAEYKPWTDRCIPIICSRAERNPRILQALSQDFLLTVESS